MFDDLPPTVRDILQRPMTPQEIRLQSLSFAYGNLAASTNHHPVREAFKKVALERGFTEDEFEAWAAPLQWR